MAVSEVRAPAGVESLSLPGTEASRQPPPGPPPTEATPDRRPERQTHAPGCPLVKAMKGEAAVASILDATARHGSSLDRPLVDDALAICARCRSLFAEYRSQDNGAQLALAQQYAAQIGELRNYRTALARKRVWRTEDLEHEFARTPRLRGFRWEHQVWTDLFRATISLLREACDPRALELPYARLTPGLIPYGWRSEDALAYVEAEVEIGEAAVRAGMAVLEKKIRNQPGRAVEPLGWFVPHEQDLFLIGWDDLFAPRRAVRLGTRSRLPQDLDTEEVPISAGRSPDGPMIEP